MCALGASLLEKPYFFWYDMWSPRIFSGIWLPRMAQLTAVFRASQVRVYFSGLYRRLPLRKGMPSPHFLTSTRHPALMLTLSVIFWYLAFLHNVECYIILGYYAVTKDRYLCDLSAQLFPFKIRFECRRLHNGDCYGIWNACRMIHHRVFVDHRLIT